ncbi:MAG: hypothetical protein OQK12_10905 [Motiliproteus sp.]|nr:hypothetical protein [Motiliproteus sp.]MCW9054320.1 hypothetical protein [Motiliproteus sp.]
MLFRQPLLSIDASGSSSRAAWIALVCLLLQLLISVPVQAQQGDSNSQWLLVCTFSGIDTIEVAGSDSSHLNSNVADCLLCCGSLDSEPEIPNSSSDFPITATEIVPLNGLVLAPSQSKHLSLLVRAPPLF